MKAQNDWSDRQTVIKDQLHWNITTMTFLRASGLARTLAIARTRCLRSQRIYHVPDRHQVEKYEPVLKIMDRAFRKGMRGVSGVLSLPAAAGRQAEDPDMVVKADLSDIVGAMRVLGVHTETTRERYLLIPPVR